MRYTHVLGLVVAAVGLVGLINAQNHDQGAEKLFNGQNLDGWRYYLDDHAVGMEDVWSVRDSLLICKGEPMGYIWTKQNYKNFHLSLEWRWAPGTEPGNNGVLMRINGQPRPLPRCLEMQLRHQQVGDLYGFHGMNLAGDPARMREVKDHALGGHLRGVRMVETSEKEPGQWNQAEIVVDGGNIRVTVNDKLVNEATDAEVVAGPLGLQSEGGEIHFRNIVIRKLPD
ncbi:MAG: DUF1080 domain-containing protein [Phycisphaerales bacterium]|nr:DUF1080 domain-containing protein [Phycisphaerales bacterium]